MKKLIQYIEGNTSDREFEQISEQLIQVKLDRDKKREWAQKLKENYGVVPNTTETVSSKRTNQLWWLSAAAVLLLVSVFFLNSPSNSTNYLAEVDHEIERLSIMSDQSVFRKGRQEIEVLRKQANLNYVNQKYEASIPLWEKLIASNEAINSDYFYLAVSHLKKANSAPHQTIALLLQSRSLQTSLAQETTWVLALAYLKAEETAKAVQELSKIVENNTYQATEAKKILALLEK